MCDGRRRDKNVTTKGNTKHNRNVEVEDLEIIREVWQIVYGLRIINRHGLELDTFGFVDKRPDSSYTLPSLICHLAQDALDRSTPYNTATNVQ
uniref:Uncharacterized protein n=1 Tax=Echinococcus canadensis TaxID=519352 RepID=A0A915EVK5_9CEST